MAPESDRRGRENAGNGAGRAETRPSEASSATSLGRWQKQCHQPTVTGHPGQCGASEVAYVPHYSHYYTRVPRVSHAEQPVAGPARLCRLVWIVRTGRRPAVVTPVLLGASAVARTGYMWSRRAMAGAQGRTPADPPAARSALMPLRSASRLALGSQQTRLALLQEMSFAIAGGAGRACPGVAVLPGYAPGREVRAPAGARANIR
jgi:hypothetical protein